MHSPHSEQHVWHCGNGCLGVGNVRMEMQSMKLDASDATPENCVGFFRVPDHNGMKCIPKADNSVVQSAEHFAVGLHS